MSVLKDIQKFCSANRLICLLGVVILAVAIGSYSMNKGSVMDGMSNARKHQAEQVIDAVQADNNVQASQPLGENLISKPFLEWLEDKLLLMHPSISKTQLLCYQKTPTAHGHVLIQVVKVV